MFQTSEDEKKPIKFVLEKKIGGERRLMSLTGNCKQANVYIDFTFELRGNFHKFPYMHNLQIHPPGGRGGGSLGEIRFWEDMIDKEVKYSMIYGLLTPARKK